jgi:hypothetical protein
MWTGVLWITAREIYEALELCTYFWCSLFNDLFACRERQQTTGTSACAFVTIPMAGQRALLSTGGSFMRPSGSIFSHKCVRGRHREADRRWWLICLGHAASSDLQSHSWAGYVWESPILDAYFCRYFGRQDRARKQGCAEWGNPLPLSRVGGGGGVNPCTPGGRPVYSMESFQLGPLKTHPMAGYDIPYFCSSFRCDNVGTGFGHCCCVCGRT